MVGTFLMIFYLHNSWTNWNCTCLQQSNMYLFISWIFLQFWFRCISPPPPHPPAKQWKKLFSWIYPFHEISCNFGCIFYPLPPPTHQPNRGEKFFFMDLSILWNFLQFGSGVFFTPRPRYVGIWDQLVFNIFFILTSMLCH